MEFPYIGLLALAGGIITLGVGAELTVNCSIKTAWRFGLSPFLIGLTLVSIGTSVPEMAVGIAGGVDRLAGLETSGIVVGNFIGSALNLLTIILGICGLFGTLTVSKRSVKRLGIALLASLLFFFFIILDREISILEGYLLIAAYAGYLAYLMFRERRLESLETSALEDEIKGFKICKMEQPTQLDIFLLIIGIALIALGSDTVIRGGIELAEYMNVEQSVIGFIFVGFGTGIPELVVSVKAVRKGDVSISIGNLLGSNVTAILLSTGIGSVIAGFTIDEKILWLDTPITILTTILALILLRTGGKLDRKESLFLILLYLFISAFVLTV